MRKIAEAIFSALWQSEDDPLPNIVKNYHDHYNRIDQLLHDMNDVLKLVHHDLQELSQAVKQEREADFTSENLFRAIILMYCEGWTFHDAAINIALSTFFQNFCRLNKKKTIDSTLQRH